MMDDPEQHEDRDPAADEATSAGDLAVPEDIMPMILPLLPVPNRPFFPGLAIPLVVPHDPWFATLKAAMDAGHHTIGVVLTRTSRAEEAAADDLYTVGSVCRIHKVDEMDDNVQVVVEGRQRFHITEWVSRERPFSVRAEYLPESRYGDDSEIKAYTLAIVNTIKELLPLNPLYGEELKIFLRQFGPEQPSQLTDFAANLTTASKQELQAVLETTDLLPRQEKVLLLLKKELELAQTESRIHKQVEEQIDARQREFFLREQLKIIQKELGLAKDDRTADIEQFRERVEGLTLTEEAQRRLDDEIDKLAVLETGSPEYAVTRNYLDWLTLLPWGRCSQDNLDLEHARGILERDHDALQDVKDRIVEFLAIGARKGEVAGSILLLVGPPGVGKTSIGRSVAAALGRQFYRFSVGGMRDEAEITGHRRTYIGAMPGKFIQAIKHAGTANPVVMIDEIDKVGASFQGDPASALLEVLDPEQNTDFLDHYLDLRFDLSRVLFVCTANQLDTIPGPLLDRMEVIRLSGYINSEKVAIAQHHLIPRQLGKAGLKHGELRIARAAVEKIVDGYAREAGVRGLEKRIAAIARKAVVRILQGEPTPVRVGARNLDSYLGKPLHTRERPQRRVGVATGLAWTPLGGATLDVEATRVHAQTRGFKLTGQLGGVMKESAEIAYSYISSHCGELHGRSGYFDKAFIHLHVPAGATPKDGPSAGITMASALLSLAAGRRLRLPVAMSGELTLTGQVLAVGGIREKVIAARRARIAELILPEDNRRDLDELPGHIRDGLTVHFVKRYTQIAALLLPE